MPSCIVPRHDPCDSCLLLESQRLLHEAGTRSSTVPTRRAKVRVKVMRTACVVGRATAASGGRSDGDGLGVAKGIKHQHVAAAAQQPWHSVTSDVGGGRAAAAVPSRRERQRRRRASHSHSALLCGRWAAGAERAHGGRRARRKWLASVVWDGSGEEHKSGRHWRRFG